MRWWLLALGVLVAVSLLLSAVGGRAGRATPGTRLLENLEAKEPLRGAIPLVTVAPEGGMEGGTAGWKEGEGGLPQGDLPAPAGSRWVQGPGFQFTWRSLRTGGGEGGGAGDPLRESLAPESEANRRVRAALSGYDAGTVDRTLEQARDELRAMGDEQLLLAWLHADRATLGQRAEFDQAARQALLLLASPSRGPVAMMESKEGRTYLLPLEPTAAADWIELAGYDPGGRLRWSGVLRLESHAMELDAGGVRALAGELARRAWAAAK